MDRDTAAKLEGMALSSRAQLEHIAEFVRTPVPAPQQRTIMLKVAAALTELVHVSWAIHDEHAHLDPWKKERALAGQARKGSEADKG